MGNNWQLADGHFVKSGKIFKSACFEKLSGQIDNHSLFLNTLSIQQANSSSRGLLLKLCNIVLHWCQNCRTLDTRDHAISGRRWGLRDMLLLLLSGPAPARPKYSNWDVNQSTQNTRPMPRTWTRGTRRLKTFVWSWIFKNLTDMVSQKRRPPPPVLPSGGVLIVCFEFLNKVWTFDDQRMVFWSRPPTSVLPPAGSLVCSNCSGFITRPVISPRLSLMTRASKEGPSEDS